MSGKYFDISEIEAAVKYAYALAEDGNSPIVEGAYVTCNQSLSVFSGEPVRAYVGLKNYTTCNSASGLGEEDIVLKPESLGVCKIRGEACKPDIEGNKWQECDSDHTINGKPGVTMNSYMVCLKGGIIAPVTDGQRIEELMEKHQELFKIEGVSDEYFEFLKAYEALGDSWSHAHKPGDGTITIAFGVVIQDKDGKIVNQELYNKWLNQTMTEEEAKEVTREYMQSYVDWINDAAKEKGWHLTQNRFDAIFDLTWNAGKGKVESKAAKLLATGDLTDETVLVDLRKEILETALMPMDDKTRKAWEEKGKLKEGIDSQWSKVLVERRMDTVLIAQGDKEAYERHSYDNQWWSENDNANVRQIFQECGLEAVDKYPFQVLQYSQ